ncbi:MAG: spore germination protein [Bacillota bacterium]
MGLWGFVKEWLTVDDSIMDDTFSLGDRENHAGGQAPAPGQDEGKESGRDKGEKRGQDKGGNPGQGGQKQPRAGRQQKVVLKQPERASKKREQQFKAKIEKNDADKWRVSPNIEDNFIMLETVFHLPENADVVVRELQVALKPPVKALVAFLEGGASSKMIDEFVLQPLMLLSNLDMGGMPNQVPEIVKQRLLPGNQVEEKHDMKDAIEGILAGTTAVFVDGYPSVFLVETKAWPHRGVERPVTENVVRGPQDAFVEDVRTNTALVRKRLKNDALVTEMLKVGRLNKSDCALMYIDGIINPKLVKEVKRRIEAIKTDYVADSGMLQQIIEDNAYALISGILSTERPDRVAAYLAEGHMAIIIDGNPFALVVPVVFWGLLHSPEDYYLYWPFGIMLRWIRLLAFVVALLTPAFYIAMTNFHPEMIPTDLLYAIAASRERVPFPVIAEVVLMEISFELIREAGVRIPTVIGPTIGIVGALILGQAAVAASVVSPILVIIVAITGLGSFAIPNYSLSFSLRILRFGFILLAAGFGFYGITVGLFVMVMQLCGQKSFGVPFMSPVAPFRPTSGDVVTRYPYYMMNEKPGYLRLKEQKRQEPVIRTWAPGNDPNEPDRQQRGQGNGQGGGGSNDGN